MPTVIGFSGSSDDFILVEEDLATVAKMLDNTQRIVEVTVLPGHGEAFSPGPGWVNPQRVAYLRASS